MSALALWTFALGCAAPQVGGGGSSPTSDISALSDEFNDRGTAGKWLQISDTEPLGAKPLERFEVNEPSGWLTIVPRTSVWYRDYRGALSYQRVQGDFVVTTRVRVTGRSGQGAPRSMFSLAGLMVRTPRPGAWRPGGENYCFLSLGAADQPGRYQFEVKTTANSDSQLQITPAAGSDARLRIARFGSTLIMLLDDGSGWRVHRRYSRPDMPKELQVGLTVYTDWNTCERMSPEQHNATTPRYGNPDLIARFEYVRFKRPTGASDIAQQSDQAVLKLLGE